MERPELPKGLPEDIEEEKGSCAGPGLRACATRSAPSSSSWKTSLSALSDQEPGRFVAKDWLRENGEGGGGRMSIMEGRVFEKSESILPPFTANSRPTSAAKSQAPRKIRASGPPACR